MRFPLDCGHTIITNLMMGHTPDEIIAEVRSADADGADAIALELNQLPPEFRNRDTFRRIIDSVQLPFMFILYRSDKFGFDDDQRQEVLLQAAEAGAGMIDVIGDLYDKSPDECTHDPAAIEKQMKLIDRIHSLGSQVVMSSHPCRPMTSDEVLNQLRSFAERGADVVKLVATADTDEQFADAVATTMRLHRELGKPFIYLCGGKFAAVQRFLGLKLGVAITFGVHEYHADAPYACQPTIRAFKTVQQNIRWHI